MSDPLDGLVDALADALDVSHCSKLADRTVCDVALPVSDLRNRDHHQRILIDSGRSRKGWSRIGRALHCLQLYAYSNVLDLALGSREALLCGTLGHTGQAHLLRRWQEEQNGRDPDVFHEPEEAMEVWCDLHPEGKPYLEVMIGVHRRYMAVWPEPPGEILLVEQEVSMVIGWRQDLSGPRWGLWVVTQESADEVERLEKERADLPIKRAEAAARDEDPNAIPGPVPPTAMQTPSGLVVEVTPLDAPGHRDHGWPIMLTRRIDAVWRERSRRVPIVDHKVTASDTAAGRAAKYAPDGQFASLRLIGAQLWPKDFSHVLLNLINREEPWRMTRHVVPATPWRDAQFAWQIYEIEHRIAQLEVRRVDPWYWPKAQGELSCWGRYGPCHGLDLCALGPSAVRGRDDRD